jgi:hypothetical protein
VRKPTKPITTMIPPNIPNSRQRARWRSAFT